MAGQLSDLEMAALSAFAREAGGLMAAAENILTEVRAGYVTTSTAAQLEDQLAVIKRKLVDMIQLDAVAIN